MASHDLDEFVYLNGYQRWAAETDQNKTVGLEGLAFPLLGLLGEVGSLLSELKKKQRDKDSYAAYATSVLEEFGDVLWYFSNIATRAKLDLSILAQRMFRDLDDWDEVESHEFGTFGDIQKFYPPEEKRPTFEKGAMELAAKVGSLLDDFSTGKINVNRDALSMHLVEVFRAIVVAADAADVSLEEAGRQNVRKILDRWPLERSTTALFDEGFGATEQLPRRFEIAFSEREVAGKCYVFQQCNGINIGDRLSDNRTEQDDYRFHDVFHLAYAGILGWSPVLRSLLKLKRKSDPAVDENEDGARAILIEEGVSTWVFNHGSRLNFYENVNQIDYNLLKSIKQFVQGYEVEKCHLWQWEEAILEGFKVFRSLRQERAGIVAVDLLKREVVFKSMKCK
jgi:NTP pyrophosphatase (non-canonical NTP hydrolase)